MFIEEFTMELPKEGLKMEGNAKIALLVVALAIFTDMVIYSMIVPILPQYASVMGASQQTIGFMFASYALMLLVASPIFGVISDRVGRKMPMVLGLAGLFLSTLMFAYANDITLLIIARALQGISAAATYTAGLALLADFFPPSQRQWATGIAITGSFAGSLIAPGIAGYLYELGGYQLPFLAAAGLVAVDGIARIFLLKDPPARVSAEKGIIKNMLKDPVILTVGGLVLITSGVISMLEPTLPIFLQTQMGTSPGAIGLLFGILALASVIFAPISFKLSDVFGRKRVIIAGIVLTALALPVLALPTSFILEAAAMAVLGAVLSIMLSSAPQEMTDAMDRRGSNAYGSVYAYYNVAMSFGMMVGPVIGGILAGYLGLALALAACAAGLLVYALLYSIISRPAAPAVSETSTWQ
jgi:multidrug resistance protein